MTVRTFPVLINQNLEASLNHRVEIVAKLFQSDVFPLLLTFGLLDDKHIMKYLPCDTTEEIYKDALEENPSKIYAMEQETLLENLKEDPNQRRDVWANFRGVKTEAKTPKDEGFVFRKLPCAGLHNKGIILKALTVKNLRFSIDTKYLQEVSIVKPTKEQIDIYNMLSDFCEAYNKKHFHARPINMLIHTDERGIYPSLHNILRLDWIYEKRS